MVILSWRISWTTVSRSVRPSRSTRGRAPSMSSIMRFWMRAVSLKRPPTLLTISSDLRASIIFWGLRCVWVRCCVRRAPLRVAAKRRSEAAGAFEGDDSSQLVDGVVEVVVEDEEVEGAGALGHGDLAAGDAEAFLDVLGLVAAAVDEAFHEGGAVGGED